MERTREERWAPFRLSELREHSDAPRALSTPEGVGDRLRAAAFAEIQARDAFLWAAEHFDDAPEALRAAWRELAEAEDRHLSWLLKRLSELGFGVSDRRVSDRLWNLLTSFNSAREFALGMAVAEERGRIAGERFHRELESRDPISAEIFRQIAVEEIGHIQLAQKYFPESQTHLKSLEI